MMTWDERKRASNIEDHKLDFAAARDRFAWESAIVVRAYANPQTKRARFKAIGRLDEDLVALVFELLGSEAISAVSLRPASRKERRLYAAPQNTAAR